MTAAASSTPHNQIEHYAALTAVPLMARDGVPPAVTTTVIAVARAAMVCRLLDLAVGDPHSRAGLTLPA